MAVRQQRRLDENRICGKHIARCRSGTSVASCEHESQRRQDVSLGNEGQTPIKASSNRLRKRRSAPACKLATLRSSTKPDRVRFHDGRPFFTILVNRTLLRNIQRKWLGVQEIRFNGVRTRTRLKNSSLSNSNLGKHLDLRPLGLTMPVNAAE